MKARDKITGEIVDIEDMSIVTYKSSDGTYVKTLIKNFTFIGVEKEYYTKLEHLYAGMAMQGLTSHIEQVTPIKGRTYCDEIVSFSVAVAHALVEKLKESKV